MSDDNKQIVVTGGGGGGSGLGLILGIVIVILIVGAVWYFGFGPGATPQGGTNINVNLPSLPANPVASP